MHLFRTLSLPDRRSVEVGLPGKISTVVPYRILSCRTRDVWGCQVYRRLASSSPAEDVSVEGTDVCARCEVWYSLVSIPPPPPPSPPPPL